ncbi:MAG TPA: hypothetical protein VGC65_10180 [Bacteroidia bacterium]|jgi:antitoxin component YwqK of YwqJK toxin-antitoxin module
MRTTLFLLATFIFCKCYAQQDTIVNGKRYNTIIYHPYFDYRGNDTIRNNYITAIGNSVDSIKKGIWTYYLPGGKILAKGKYKKGYKRGEWIYTNSNKGSTALIWAKSAKATDFIRYSSNNNRRAEIIDVVHTKRAWYRMVNGFDEFTFLGCRFL